MTSSSSTSSSFRFSSCPNWRNFRDDDDRRQEVRRRPEIQPEVEAPRHDLDEAVAVQSTAAAAVVVDSNSDAAVAVELGIAAAEVDE